jgi:ABC-2 type transport system ATP-binding protein
MLKINDLHKKFGETVAVDGVSLEIKGGEIFSLIGPNGSGKTTIIKTVAGLLSPGIGEILVAKKDVVKEPEEAKSLVGYIPDEPMCWPSMTGEEFLHFVGALYGIEEPVRVKKISEMLGTFGLSGIEKSYFEDYSRGNKQKFSIMAALLHEPKLLLVDEPIVGLDPESAKTAKKLFSEFAKRGGAVLLVTHTLAVAEEISSHIGLLKNGKIVATGSMKELISASGLKEGARLEDVYNAKMHV